MVVKWSFVTFQLRWAAHYKLPISQKMISLTTEGTTEGICCVTRSAWLGSPDRWDECVMITICNKIE